VLPPQRLCCLTEYGQVELIWRSKWSIPKVLYLLSRYLPLVDTTATFLCALLRSYDEARLLMISFADNFLYDLSPKVCGSSAECT
jgi:hypothetical protein